MEITSKTFRASIVTLTAQEFNEAIVDYLKKQKVQDYDQHVTFKPIETHDERGLILEIEIKNYNLK